MDRKPRRIPSAALALTLMLAGCASEARRDGTSHTIGEVASPAKAMPTAVTPDAAEPVWRRLPIAGADVEVRGCNGTLTVSTRTPPGWTVRVKEVPSDDTATQRFELVGLGQTTAASDPTSWPGVSVVDNVELRPETELLVLTGSDGDLVMEVAVTAP